MLVALAAASFALTALGTYQQYEQAKEQADMQKDNIEIQRNKLALQKEKDLLDREIAEAEVRKKERAAKANIAMKQAISGTEGSIYDAMETGVETSTESGMEIIKQKAGIQSAMSDLSSESLAIQESGIQSSWDMELGAALGVTSAGINSGMLAYQGMKDSSDWSFTHKNIAGAPATASTVTDYGGMGGR